MLVTDKLSCTGLSRGGPLFLQYGLIESRENVMETEKNL